MNGLAKVSVDTGVVFLPVGTPYDQDVLFEYLRSIASAHKQVEVELERLRLLVSENGVRRHHCAGCERVQARRISREDVLTLIDRASDPPVVVIAPDRHGKGTNALLISPSGRIEYDFGENSFPRHCERVQRSGARLDIVNLPSLSLDLDLPEDLELIRKMDLSRVGP